MSFFIALFTLNSGGKGIKNLLFAKTSLKINFLIFGIAKVRNYFLKI